MAQNRIFEISATSTHTISDLFPARIQQHMMAGLLPSKWVPNAAETATVSHDGYFGFCPANSQLYRRVVKSSQGKTT
jgi:hypothetical protein